MMEKTTNSISMKRPYSKPEVSVDFFQTEPCLFEISQSIDYGIPEETDVIFDVRTHICSETDIKDILW